MSVAQPAPSASGCATRRGGGHLSFVVAGNAAGLTATAAGPGSFYGPHQLRLLSLYLSLHSVDYSTDHSSPSETSFTIREDPIPPKLDEKISCCLARGKSAGQSANELAPAFLERLFFLLPFGRRARSGSELFYYYRIVSVPHSTSFRSPRSALGPQPS